MRAHRRLLFVLFPALLGACAPGAPQGGPSPEFPIETVRLSERAIVLTTLDANVTALASERGIVLIDTHRSPALMERIREAIRREFGRADIRYVVNTHGHWDHSSGNQAVRDAILIGHGNCPEYMRQNPLDTPGNRWHLEERLSAAREALAAPEDSSRAAALAAEVKAREAMMADLAGRYAVTPPSLTFSDRLSLDLGDVTLDLFYCGENHTDNDLLAYVPEEGLVLTGDLFTGRERFGFSVNRMMDIPRLLSVLDGVLADGAGVRAVVPGHGDPMTGEDLLALRDRLRERHAALGEERSAARTLRALLDEHGIEEALRRFGEARERGSAEAGYLSESEFDTLGFRLIGKGRIREAVEVFRIAVEVFPDSALLHDSLGEACMRAGDTEGARRGYERSLALNPYNRNASGMLEILRGQP